MPSDSKPPVIDRPLSRRERRARERGKGSSTQGPSGVPSRDERSQAPTNRDEARPGGNYRHRGDR